MKTSGLSTFKEYGQLLDVATLKLQQPTSKNRCHVKRNCHQATNGCNQTLQQNLRVLVVPSSQTFFNGKLVQNGRRFTMSPEWRKIYLKAPIGGCSKRGKQVPKMNYPLVSSNMAGWTIPYEWRFYSENHLVHGPFSSTPCFSTRGYHELSVY